MDTGQILTIAIICSFFFSAGIVALYYILRAVNKIKTKEHEAGKAFETEFLLSEEAKAKAESFLKEKPSNCVPPVTDTAEPDAYAKTLDNISQFNGNESVQSSPSPAIQAQHKQKQNDQDIPQRPSDHHSTIVSPMEELRHQARSGNPVAAAVWKIYQAGQLETLEEIIPMGASYSPAQAILLVNGKRWIVLPPNHPENILARLSADCDAFVVFPDGITPFMATSLGQYLVDNIFESGA